MANREQVESLQRKISPFMLRRVKEDVAKDIPAKEETVIPFSSTMFRRTLQTFVQPVRSARPASSFVDRVRLQETIKENEEACRTHLAKGKLLLMHKGRPLMDRTTRGAAWTSPNSDLTNDDFAFLGLDDDGVGLFAVNVTDRDPASLEEDGRTKFVDLRKALFTAADGHQPLLTRAWSLLQWHRKTKFCAACGGKLERSYSGSHRACGDCGAVYYPHLSPVGIVLVAARDNSKVLLIRQPRYPPGMYSCVAGFVDVGESLEQCVQREVAEEVGIEVTDVRVLSV